MTLLNIFYFILHVSAPVWVDWVLPNSRFCLPSLHRTACTGPRAPDRFAPDRVLFKLFRSFSTCVFWLTSQNIHALIRLIFSPGSLCFAPSLHWFASPCYLNCVGHFGSFLIDFGTTIGYLSGVQSPFYINRVRLRRFPTLRFVSHGVYLNF